MNFIEKVKTRAMPTGKRGNSWGLIVLSFMGVLVGVAITAIVISNLKGTQTSTSVAYQILNNTETFVLNATGQLGSAGTVLGIMALVAIVTAFGFLGYQKFAKSR